MRHVELLRVNVQKVDIFGEQFWKSEPARGVIPIIQIGRIETIVVPKIDDDASFPSCLLQFNVKVFVLALKKENEAENYTKKVLRLFFSPYPKGSESRQW